MNRSWFASAALAKCSLEIDSLAYRGLPVPSADGAAGRSYEQALATWPAPNGCA
jgi:hypothetical protein